jgi:hypothetical protein
MLDQELSAALSGISGMHGNYPWQRAFSPLQYHCAADIYTGCKHAELLLSDASGTHHL